MTNPIVEHFGRRKPNGATEPSMPPIARPAPLKPDPRHAEALTYVEGLKADLDAALSENSRLRHDLGVAVAVAQEIKRLHDIDREELNRQMAYASEARTFFQAFVDLSKRAHESSKRLADNPPAPESKLTPEQASAIIEGVEQELKAEEIGKKFGPREEPETSRNASPST